VALEEELRRIAEAAAAFGGEDEELVGIVPAEPGSGVRTYLCAYRDESGEARWLLLDAAGTPVDDRSLVRDAVSIAAMCELAEEAAGAQEETRLATPALLDALGANSGDRNGFVQTMKQATATVEELVRDVERNYKGPLR
jgi:hypothetical protein